MKPACRLNFNLSFCTPGDPHGRKSHLFQAVIDRDAKAGCFSPTLTLYFPRINRFCTPDGTLALFRGKGIRISLAPFSWRFCYRLRRVGGMALYRFQQAPWY